MERLDVIVDAKFGKHFFKIKLSSIVTTVGLLIHKDKTKMMRILRHAVFVKTSSLGIDLIAFEKCEFSITGTQISVRLVKQRWHDTLADILQIWRNGVDDAIRILKILADFLQKIAVNKRIGKHFVGAITTQNVTNIGFERKHFVNI